MNFEEFYEFYLTQHSNKNNMRLHFIGTTLVVLLVVLAIFTRQFRLLLLCPLVGYSFARTGHFLFEKNKPAAFKKPLYSLICDFKMWFEILSFRRRI